MKDPRDDIEGGGIVCAFCKEDTWGPGQMQKTPTDDWICPNCRVKCDYCEQYFPTNEITRSVDGKACSDCMFDHELMPMDELELYDTLSTILRL